MAVAEKLSALEFTAFNDLATCSLLGKDAATGYVQPIIEGRVGKS